MTNCEKIQEMISAMLDGELSEQERIEIKEHIALCSDCAAMYEDFAALREELKESLAEVPASLHANIMDAVRSAPKPKKPLQVLMRPYMSAAACLIIVAGIALAARAGSLGPDKAVSSGSKLAVPAAPAAPEAPAEAEMYTYGNFAVADAEEFFTAAPVPAPEAAIEAPMAPEAPAEPAAPAEPEGFYVPEIIPGDEDSINEHFRLTYDHRDTFGPLNFHFEPGLPLENVYLAFFDDSGNLISVSIIEDTDALCAALVCEDRNWENWDNIPNNRSAILEFECHGFPHSMELFFDGSKVVVETIDDYYRAVGSVEELLSIK